MFCHKLHQIFDKAADSFFDILIPGGFQKGPLHRLGECPQSKMGLSVEN